jgi:hypothetical protein
LWFKYPQISAITSQDRDRDISDLHQVGVPRT